MVLYVLRDALLTDGIVHLAVEEEMWECFGYFILTGTLRRFHLLNVVKKFMSEKQSTIHASS